MHLWPHLSGQKTRVVFPHVSFCPPFLPLQAVYFHEVTAYSHCKLKNSPLIIFYDSTTDSLILGVGIAVEMRSKLIKYWQPIRDDDDFRRKQVDAMNFFRQHSRLVFVHSKNS